MKRPSSTTQAEFNRKLQNGQVAPLYLFEGPELYLRDQALKRLAQAAIDESVMDFNFAQISVAHGNLDEALGLARQFPMISQRRMVVVTGFEAVSDDKQLELLKEYLRDPAETTVLVFVSDGLDNRRNIATALRKACEYVGFDRLDDRDGAPNWVRDYVSRSGSFIEPSAIGYLIGMVGVDLLRLSTELDKLMAYAGEKGRITTTEIDELVIHTREHSNFELTDAIVDGDRKRALTILNHIFSNPPEPPQTLSILILGAIASNYRRLLMAKELMRQNVPNSEVAKAVGMSPYGVTRLNERARKLESARIVKGIERIAQTDVALKTSMATPRLQLELLICELCPAGKSLR